MLTTPDTSNLAFTRRKGLAAALAGAATFGLGLKAAGSSEETLPVEGEMPPLASGLWLNSAPLTREGLRGKVVLECAGVLFHRRAGPHSPSSFRRGRICAQ